MPNLNINWKGYPYRRLPRIRIRAAVRSATDTTIRTRSIHRIVPTDSIRRPLGAQVERKRKKQRLAIRRRRARKSRSSSSAARARKHASLRAKQHIQTFGWDAGLACTASTIKIRSATSSIKGLNLAAASTVPEHTFTHTTAFDSNDGAAASAYRLRESTQPEQLYSLMHVAETPSRWTNRRKVTLASSQASSRASKRAREYANVGPLDPVSKRHSSRSPRRVGKSRTYDARIDPRILLDRDRLTKSFPITSTATTQRIASRRAPGKSWQGNPELRRTLSSKVSTTKTYPQSATPSMKSVVQSLPSDPGSRTPNQRKALKRFTEELEFYLLAAKSLPKHSLVPSPSATTVSVHTIEELRPYQAQLRSAGFAVTAADQLREISIMAKSKKSPCPPPTPPKDAKYSSRKSAATESKLDQNGAHHHCKMRSVASFDTETTVMDFTPPHEQNSPRNTRGRRRSSSDHTIMAFTPPHESPPPQPKHAPPPPPRAPTNKSLPWLRRPGPAEKSPTPSRQDRGIVTASTEQDKTRNSSDVLLFPAATEWTAKRTTNRPKKRLSEHRTTEKRWQDKKLSTGSALDKRELYNDAAVQAAPELSENYTHSDHGIHSADATTQTEFVDAGRSSKQDVERRPQLAKNKHKTFSISPNKGPGDCSHLFIQPSALQSSQKTYRDLAMQTDLVKRNSNNMQSKAPESKRPSFKTQPQSPKPNCTFLFVSPSPFQRSLVARNPQESVYEIGVRKSRDVNDFPVSKASTPEASPSPTHHNASPLRCTQCAADVLKSRFEPQVEPQPESEPASLSDRKPEFEPDREAESRLQSPPRRSHTCTARSSLECQQCAPAKSPAPVLERNEQTDSPRSLKRSSRQSPVRTTHWAAILEAELEEIFQGHHSPEEQFMQRKVVQDLMEEWAKPPPLADPVKKSHQSRLKLQTPPTTHTHTKQLGAKPAATAGPAPIFLDTALPQSPTVSSTLTRDSSGISDRAVFRGLHVATAAACDEDVAKRIEEITGACIRRFLADISVFDGMGFNTLAGIAKRAAEQRRGEIMARERVQEQKLQDRDANDGWEGCPVEETKGVGEDRKMEFGAGNKTANLKAERERSGEEVLNDMITARECRTREGLRERAIRMGWRDRSASGQA